MVRNKRTVSEDIKGRQIYGVKPHSRRNIFIFRTNSLLSDFVIAHWILISEKAIKEKGRFTVALSGGSTPVFLYKKLSLKNGLPWKKTHLFQTDERFVSPEDDESNFFMINKTLLSRINIPKNNIHPILTDEETAGNSAVKYDKKLTAYFKKTGKGLPQFDLVLLGIGEDGHTASLFPQTEAVKEAERFAMPVSLKNKTNNDRITITLPLINNARNIMFLVTGSKKGNIMKEVIDKKDSSLPAVKVKQRNGRLFFLLDESAGKFIKNNKEVIYVKG